MIGGIRHYGRKLLDTGFWHIVGAGSVNKVLSLLMSVVLVRALSVSDYGCYAYAFNIVSFFILFNGLGVTSAILQICSELFYDAAKSDAVYAYGYRSGVIADIAMGGLIAAVAMIAPLAIDGSNEVLLIYCAYPLLSLLCEIKLTYLRVRLRNKEYAFLTNVQTVLTVVFSIAGALSFQVAGLVIGQCTACICAWLLMCAKNPQRGALSRIELPRNRKFDFWKLSLVSALNNALGAALTLVGTTLVGALLLSADLVAQYKVATTIPFALLFVPGMVVTYIYPYFARHKDDGDWTRRNYSRLIVVSVLSMGAITGVFAVLAEPIVVLVFGEEYRGSVPVLQVLMIGFFITSSFRQPAGNLLVTQRKLLFNTFSGVVSIVTCIAATFLLIPAYGMVGAAVAYDATMLVGAALNVGCYVRAIRRI